MGRVANYREIGEELERLYSTQWGRFQLFFIHHLPRPLLTLWDVADGTWWRERNRQPDERVPPTHSNG
jgi:hypothetical protein